MKRKWIKFIDEKYGVTHYRCKICGLTRMKKRNVLYHCSINHTKWEKRDEKAKHEESMIWNIEFNSSEFNYKYLNPKAINISILFNGAIDCLFCIYFNYCTKDFCIHDFSNIKLTKEQLEVKRLWRGFD